MLILDTSVLCCWLQVPGKETAGSARDRWDYDRINKLINREINNGSTLVLPVASLIETGNHAAQSSGDRFQTASRLGEIIKLSASATTPWAAFTEQAELWSAEKLLELSQTWPQLAAGGTSIGDATIKDVAEWYASAGFSVEIVTGDAGLKAYEPTRQILTPRRRR